MRGITSRAAGLAVAIAAIAAGTAQAAPPAPPPPAPAAPAPVRPAPPGPPSRSSACGAPSYEFSQPFATFKDNNWYTLAPGQGADGFTGQGWTLTGGAHIVSATLPDGTTEMVLDLPAGATAVSPTMCVDSDYPSARVGIRDVVGPPGGLHLYVAYTSTPSWEKAQDAGAVPGNSAWSLSPPLQLNSGGLFGWQLAQYTFTAANKTEAQIYDFYVDPRGMV